MMKNVWRQWAWVGMAALLSACGGGGEVDRGAVQASQASQERIEPYERTADTEPAHRKRHDATRRPAALKVQLGPWTAPKAAMPDSAAGTMAPRQIGWMRRIDAVADFAGTASLLRWQRTAAGGWVAALSIQSDQAAAVRLGLRVERLPGVAVVRLYAPSAADTWEVPGREILATIERNKAAGDSTEGGRTFWLPGVSGAEATIEIELPPGFAPASVEVAVPQLAHLQEDPSRTAPAQEQPRAIGDGGSCNVDVACAAQAGDEVNAVAKIEFVKPGGVFLCTGTLMADSIASRTPYFLTANHCISTQTAASSLVSHWFFRAAACGGTALDPARTTRAGGAALLYTTAQTDTTLLRLQDMPPSGAVYAGSLTAAPRVGLDIAGVHHPRGDLMKYSRGQTDTFANCTSNGSVVSCVRNASAGSFVGARWTSGTTEPGSSGSALFSTHNGRKYVIGQLSAGSSSCANPAGLDFYGRFDLAFQAGVRQWLEPTAGNSSARSPVYRFYNAGTQAHFYTVSLGERDAVIANNAAFRYEGVAFFAHTALATGLNPVFRFYYEEGRTHFYTISTLERDDILRGNPAFKFEAPVWAARLSPGNDSVPIHRFYNAGSRIHFYTISEAEKDSLIRSNPAYTYEGVAYYAWTR